MKKGFTLVELLAVIILIGVITLMTTTVIGSKIDDSKMKVLYNDTIKIKKLIEDDCNEKAADGISVTEYELNNNLIGDVELKGTIPDYIKVNSLGDECSFEIFAKQGKFCTYSNSSNSDILVGKYSDNKCLDKDNELIIETASE